MLKLFFFLLHRGFINRGTSPIISTSSLLIRAGLFIIGMIPAASLELLGLVKDVVEEEDEASEEIERRERNHQA